MDPQAKASEGTDEPSPFPPKGFREPTVKLLVDGIKFCVVPFALTYAVVMLLVPAVRWPTEPIPRAQKLLELRLPERAVAELQAALMREPPTRELIRALVIAHFQKPAYANKKFRDDDRLQAFLDATTFGDDRLRAYALGAFEFERGQPEAALREMGEARLDEEPELRLLRGRALARLGRHTQAVETLRPLFTHRSWRRPFVYAAASSLRSLGEWSALRAHIAEDPTQVPENVRGTVLIHDGRFFAYAGHALRAFYRDIWWPYLAAVLFGGLVWFVFVRRVNIFVPEPMAWSCAAVFGGACAGQLILIMVEMEGVLYSFRPSGGLFHDLIYYVVEVGLHEEFAKLVPVLLIARFSRQMTEPSDWLVYGALSGIGFATLENIHYAAGIGPGVILTRSFVAAPLHMAMSGSIAAAVPEARVRGKSPRLWLSAAVLFVAFVHGLLDFLVTRKSGMWAVFSILIVVYAALVFMTALGHALARSPARRNPVAEKVFLGGYLAKRVVLCACALLFAVAFRLPEEFRGQFFAKTLYSCMSLWIPLAVYGVIEVPERWDRAWWKNLPRKREGK